MNLEFNDLDIFTKPNKACYKKISKKDYSNICKDYISGVDGMTLSKKYKRAQSTIYFVLKKAGIKTRSRWNYAKYKSKY